MNHRTAIVVGLALLADTLNPPVANADSSAYVRTESGQTRCLITEDDSGHGGGPAVACEHGPGFPQAPVSKYGFHYDLAVVEASGAFRWDNGNIGGGAQQNDIVLNYGQTYHIHGWTITPSYEGTRFTNDRTDHGMFVAIENVSPF
jgi:hypothetical protein